jgi:hypothetical protein
LETDPNTSLEITASIFEVQADVLIHKRTNVGLQEDGAPYRTYAVSSNDLGSVTKHVPIAPYTVNPVITISVYVTPRL